MNSLWGAFEFLDKGGWVAWTLALLSALLWYAIGYRYLYLQSQYLGQEPKDLLERQSLSERDLLGQMTLNIQKQVTQAKVDLELALQVELKNFVNSLKVHRQTIKSIVVVAPLLGLLGTVIGMIETFESLQDASLFSQSGGIAGGISQALITTQMGLVVAIPGLLIGRRLDRREQEMVTFGERMLGVQLLKGVRS